MDVLFGASVVEVEAVVAPIVHLLVHVYVVLDSYLLFYSNLQTRPSRHRLGRLTSNHDISNENHKRGAAD